MRTTKPVLNQHKNNNFTLYLAMSTTMAGGGGGGWLTVGSLGTSASWNSVVGSVNVATPSVSGSAMAGEGWLWASRLVSPVDTVSLILSLDLCLSTSVDIRMETVVTCTCDVVIGILFPVCYNCAQRGRLAKWIERRSYKPLAGVIGRNDSRCQWLPVSDA